jgi:hypothetical protein
VKATSASTRKTIGHHRFRLGTPARTRPLIATPVVSGNQGNRFLVLTLVVCVPAATIAKISEVGKAAGPVGVTLAGVNAHVAPAGIPPVQANVIVEWKPSSGIAVSTTGLDIPPWATVAEEPEEEKVKVPTEARMFSVMLGEILRR